MSINYISYEKSEVKTQNSKLKTQNPHARGTLLVVISATAFGLMPVLTKLAYEEGLNTRTLLTMRFGIAALGMWLIWALRRRARLGLRNSKIQNPKWVVLVPLIALGALGYVGQSFSYFTAVNIISASTTSLLLYTYPVLVTILAWIFFREALTLQKWAALGLGALGALLILGLFSQVSGNSPSGVSSGTGALGSAQPTGVLWALAAAGIYSIYIIAGTRFTSGIDPIFSSAVIISSAAVVYAVWGALVGDLDPSVTIQGLTWTAVIALVCTVLAITTFFAGLPAVGPSRAAIISTIEPAVSVVLAAFVLGERIGPEQLFGGALVLAAVLVLQIKPVSGDRKAVGSRQ